MTVTFIDSRHGNECIPSYLTVIKQTYNINTLFDKKQQR